MAWVELRAVIGSGVEFEWVTAAASEGESGIVAVHVLTPSVVVRLYLFSNENVKGLVTLKFKN